MPSQPRTAGLPPDLSAESAHGELDTSPTTTQLQDPAELADALVESTVWAVEVADMAVADADMVDMVDMPSVDNPAPSPERELTARLMELTADSDADKPADTRRPSASSHSQRLELDMPDGSTATTDSSDLSEETISPRVSNGDMLSSLRTHAREVRLSMADTPDAEVTDMDMESAEDTPTEPARSASMTAKSQRRLFLRRPSQESSASGRTQSSDQM